MSPRKIFSIVAALAALAGLAASIRAYLSPETGVDGTAGPLLTALGTAGMILLAVLLLVTAAWRGAALALYLLAGIATCFAAVLLQQPLILIPAVVALCTLPVGQMLGDAG